VQQEWWVTVPIIREQRMARMNSGLRWGLKWRSAGPPTEEL